jgi:NagD protein
MTTEPAGPWPRPGRRYDGYALDLDGTVYLGDALLPGAAATIASIREAGSSLVFLTNNPLKPAAAYAAKLTGLGIPATEADVVTPLAVLTSYLHEKHPGAAVLTVAEPLVDETLAAAGITVTRDPAAAGVVAVSFDRTFDYAKLLAAYRAVRLHGAAIVATNPDPPRTAACPTALRCSPRSRPAPAPGPRPSSASRASTWRRNCSAG